MPYPTVESLPPAVKKLSDVKQRQWMHVWNSAYDKTNNEKTAFAEAWGVVNKGDEDTISMTARELVLEHVRLVHILLHGTKEEQEKEAKEQGKELKEYEAVLSKFDPVGDNVHIPAITNLSRHPSLNNHPVDTQTGKRRTSDTVHADEEHQEECDDEYGEKEELKDPEGKCDMHKHIIDHQNCIEIFKSDFVNLEKLTPGASNYADPGWQKDGKKRYPLDTAKRANSAGSYFGNPANRAKYSSAHASTIDRKIAAAKKKFGIGQDNVSKSSDILVTINKNSLVDGLVYGIVYEPLKKDAHGDWSTAEEIQKWAHNFLPSALSTNSWSDVHHRDNLTKNDVEVVESYIAPVDFAFPSGEKVIKGSWVLVSRVNNAELKKAIEDGEITGYSLAGMGKKVDLDLPIF